MTREIKFRAWDSVLKMWWSRDSFEDKKLSTFFEWVEKAGKGVFLVEYLGLKDKNGKEVYEGDDCNYQAAALSKMVHGGIVKFNQQKMRWYCGLHTMDRLTDYEVIGNIYENKNLIK